MQSEQVKLFFIWGSRKLKHINKKYNLNQNIFNDRIVVINQINTLKDVTEVKQELDKSCEGLPDWLCSQD